MAKDYVPNKTFTPRAPIVPKIIIPKVPRKANIKAIPDDDILDPKKKKKSPTDKYKIESKGRHAHCHDEHDLRKEIAKDVLAIGTYPRANSAYEKVINAQTHYIAREIVKLGTVYDDANKVRHSHCVDEHELRETIAKEVLAMPAHPRANVDYEKVVNAQTQYIAKEIIKRGTVY
jgi:hypothetical protein